MIEQLATTMLFLLGDVSLRATVVAACVAGVLWAVRVRSSRVEHAAWTGVLAATLLMPILSWALPPLTLHWSAARRSIERVTRPPSSDGSTTAVVVETAVPRAGVTRVTEPAPIEQRTAASPVEGGVGRRTVAPVVGVAALYLLGLGLYGFRLIAGWIATTRLIQRGRHAMIVESHGVLESDELSTPACVGIFSPRIVLPANWRSWGADTLQAVLSHERAHLARRDPLTRLLAQLACCLFWFHPLVWWIRNRLAALAEFSCDAAALRESNSTRYADVLIEMARTARRHHGRLAWVGVSSADRGQLAQRIARVLDGHVDVPMSLLRKCLVSTISATTVLAVAACRPEPPPLRENPEYVSRDAENRAARQLVLTVKAMTAADIADLEASWKHNPEDLETLRKILIYYGPDSSGKLPRDQAPVVQARRPYILWLIEHHPDYDTRMGLTAQISLTNRGPGTTDPEGYEAAKKLWIAHAERLDVKARTLGNGAGFLARYDGAVAEQMLLKAQRIAPSAEWSASLGDLYAGALLGSNEAMYGNIPRSSGGADRRGDFARHARATLDASTDARLLLAAGQRLAMWNGDVVLDVDAKALGRRYLERTVELTPNFTGAHRALATVKLRDLHDKGQDDPDGLLRLISRAQGDYLTAEYLEYQGKDRDKARELWERSRQSARDALSRSAQPPHHPHAAVTMYAANIVLATHALREGNRQEAVRLMGEATKAPPSDNFRLPVVLLDLRLVNYLLKYGERESVASFLERSAALRTHEKDRLLKDAADIRAGLMTFSYHATFNRAQ